MQKWELERDLYEAEEEFSQLLASKAENLQIQEMMEKIHDLSTEINILTFG